MTPRDVDFKMILFKGKSIGGKNPIMLQFKVGEGKYKRMAIKVYGYPDDWNKDFGMFANQSKYLEENKKIIAGIEKTNSVLKQMDEMGIVFTVPKFKELFWFKEKQKEKVEKNNIPTSLTGFLQWYIEDLTKKDKIGDRACFKTLNSILKKFKTKDSFKLDDVDKFWLEDFQNKLLERKNRKGEPISSVTVWSYLKTLRTLMSKARYYEVTLNNPFRNAGNPNGFGFQALERKPRISRSMSDEELDRFFQFNWLGAKKREKLSYLTCYLIYLFRGIPISDLAMLTIDNIHNDEISFGRVKTHKKVPNIPLTEKRKEILAYLKPFTDGYYLIPILRKDFHKTTQQKYNRIGKLKTYINSGLKEIAKSQNIKVNLTTYTFRHTYARKVLNKHGIWKLKEALGHESILTTQKYAGSLSDKEVAKTDDVFDDIF